ncbi:AAA family ATPase [uncultured Neptuniibacter sp.]|uniref:AAA family ATPase n=1 Tax=uncultured Neptuniibacter sp. TaxID=502143 RepID=UPI002635026C|nr:AAA family ATPase [uncultured Neptuniibacter sp.]
MKPNIYFEPPSRLQLLDKLKHWVRFSDFLLVISGERGSGKSTLLSQLLPEQGDTTLVACHVCSELELNEQVLLEHLSSQFPSHDEVDRAFSDKLHAFSAQLKAVSSAGQKCLIIIDDAEQLTDNALNLLINLHASGAQLVLISGESYAEKVLGSELVKHMEGRVHHIEIPSMTREESYEYLQICHPELSTLPEKQKRELVQLGDGMPGRIETLLAGGKVISSKASKKKTAFPLPGIHMLGIGFVLMAIVALSLWQFMPEKAVVDELEITERVSVPLPVPAENEAEVVTVTPATEPVATEAVEGAEQLQDKALDENALAEKIKADLAARLKEQEAKIEVEQERLAEDSAPVSAPVASAKTVVVEPSPSVVAASKKQSSISNKEEIVLSVNRNPTVKEVEPAAKGVDVSSDEKDLLSWSSSDYTLQMLGARSEESALGFVKSQQEPDKFYLFSTVYKGAPWFVVVYGQYANRDLANASIKRLPAALRKVRPWARSVQGVQIDIRKKK